MRKPDLKRIVAMLWTLTTSQLKAISAEVAALESQLGATAVIEGQLASGAVCPHRRSRYVPGGQANGFP